MLYPIDITPPSILNDRNFLFWERLKMGDSHFCQFSLQLGWPCGIATWLQRHKGNNLLASRDDLLHAIKRYVKEFFCLVACFLLWIYWCLDVILGAMATILWPWDNKPENEDQPTEDGEMEETEFLMRMICCWSKPKLI